MREVKPVSPRKYITTIFKSLNSVGFDGITPNDLLDSQADSIYFNDNSIGLIDKLVKEVVR